MREGDLEGDPFFPGDLLSLVPPSDFRVGDVCGDLPSVLPPGDCLRSLFFERLDFVGERKDEDRFRMDFTKVGGAG